MVEWGLVHEVVFLLVLSLPTLALLENLILSLNHETRYILLPPHERDQQVILHALPIDRPLEILQQEVQLQLPVRVAQPLEEPPEHDLLEQCVRAPLQRDQQDVEAALLRELPPDLGFC